MKKTFFLVCFFLLLCFPSCIYAQQEDENVALPQRFPTLRVKDQFNQVLPIKYYRFPQDTWFYEPLDLSYFPHEKWEKKSWALLGRWKDGKTYNQTIYLDKIDQKKVIHGTDIGQAYGFFTDFYLYADLFILDNYPKDTGSCYLYFSNSLQTGFKQSKGIMIDPENGIYKSTNSYGTYYSQNHIHHDLSLIQELDPNDYKFVSDNIEKTSIGSSQYQQLNMDSQFLSDFDSVSAAYRNPNASSVKVYRIEVVRENGVSDIYINGILVGSINDGIITKDKKPDKVTVSYGPLLKAGGIVVTCSIGNLFIYTN